MGKLCAVDGCPGSKYRKKRGEKIYYFRVLEDQVDEWNSAIPGGFSELKLHDKVCSRHFKDEDLLKEWNFDIDNKPVTLPRGRWTLRIGAVPAIFDGYKKVVRVMKDRKSKPKSFFEFSSSDEAESPPPKKKRKTKSPHKVVKNPDKRDTQQDVSKIPQVKSLSRGRRTKENSFNESDSEGSWEKACDGLVDQLSSLIARTPTSGGYAKPAERSHERHELGREPVEKVSLIPSPLIHPVHSNDLDREISSTILCTSDEDSRNSLIIEEFVASSSEAVDDNLSSLQMKENFQMPSDVTVKEERIDECFEDRSYLSNDCSDCRVIGFNEDPTSLQILSKDENARTFEEVVVKREICDCEGSQCCESHTNGLEVPASPERQAISRPTDDSQIICEEELHVEDLPLDQNQSASRLPSPARILEPETCEHEMPSISGSPETSFQPVVPSGADHKSLEETPVKMDLTEKPIGKALETPTNPSVNNQPNTNVATGNTDVVPAKRGPGRPCTPYALVAPEQETAVSPPETSHLRRSTRSHCAKARQGFETDVGKSSQALKKPLYLEESSDNEIDFLGFSSGEEEASVSKRKHYQNTARMAAKSTGLFFSKLSQIRKPVVDNSQSKQVSPPKSHQTIPTVCQSSVSIAINQLNSLESMLPIRSKKPVRDRQKSSGTLEPVVREMDPQCLAKSEPKQTSVRNIPSSSPSVAEGSASGWKCADESGSISSEGTVTKFELKDLDEAPRSSNLRHRTYSRVNPLSNWSASSSEHLLKEKANPTLNQSLVADKIVTDSDSQLKEQGTSKIETNKIKDKLSSFNAATERMSLLKGSLERIIQTTASSSPVSSGANFAPSDPTIDKTSVILKNFKSDGVLALECVVLKEQVRQLQKELFLHKQMLVDSEHNASLLQRRLELQAKLPCVNCENIKRGFVVKETLI